MSEKTLQPANSDAIKKAFAILQKAKSDVEKTLSAKEHSTLLLGITAGFNKISNKLAFLSGVNINQDSKRKFDPITNFMGEDLSIPEPIKEDDLSPSEKEKAVFISKVDKLYASIDTIAIDGLLNDYKLPEDVLVIRGIAKRAGVEGYEDKEISVKFIEEIIAAKKQKEADDAEQTRIEEELKKQEAAKKQKD